MGPLNRIPETREELPEDRATKQRGREDITEILERFSFFIQDNNIFMSFASYILKNSLDEIRHSDKIGEIINQRNCEIIVIYQGEIEQILDAYKLKKTCEHSKINYKERFNYVSSDDLKEKARILEEIAQQKEQKK